MREKKIHILQACVALFALCSLTACIEETFPESATVTEDLVKQNPTSAESFVQGLPAKFNTVWAEDYHFSFGYGAMMHIRDQWTQDLCEGGNVGGYDWWQDWAQNKFQGDGYVYCQFIWNYYYGFIKTVNNVLETLPDDPEEFTETQRGYYGVALAYRAMLYLDMARMYEYLPCDATEGKDPTTGNDVTNLTIPIVKDGITEEEARHNPRAHHRDMAAFIEHDLQEALENIDYLPTKYVDPTMPNKACVYGLLARLYMWNEDYAHARENARLAIEESGLSPMDKEGWTNVNNGFNDIDLWMWGAVQTKDIRTVTSGIINWISWISNQTVFGYTGSATGMYVVMDRNMYNRISNNDFRKYVFVAPATEYIRNYNKVPAGINIGDMPNYTSLKFRPAQGEINNYLVGAAVPIPIMRVEEMYFIEAEAAAHLVPAEGKQLLINFMKQYRDGSYNCYLNDPQQLVEEIVFQKRVELWGEGQTFFDVKRLNLSVQRGYTETNHPELERFNTNGRPAWMNVVLIRTEANNNEAVEGWNNPDPSDAYQPWTK